MGAWTQYYEYPKWYEANTPHGWGLKWIKQALLDQGYGKTTEIKLDGLQFGNYVRDAVKAFQKSKGLEVDGVVGPKTAKALWRRLVLDMEGEYGIPEHLLGKKTILESNFDSAAIGTVDPRDRGMNQINSGAHPDVSDEEAFSPYFSLPWAANYLKYNYDQTKDWDAALAAYNIGLYYAKKWLAAGKPASGVMTSGGKDIAVVATRYVKLVKSQTF